MTGRRWILNKGQLCGALMFSYSCYTVQATEQTVEAPVIWDAVMLMWRHSNERSIKLGNGRHTNVKWCT